MSSSMVHRHEERILVAPTTSTNGGGAGGGAATVRLESSTVRQQDLWVWGDDRVGQLLQEYAVRRVTVTVSSASASQYPASGLDPIAWLDPQEENGQRWLPPAGVFVRAEFAASNRTVDDFYRLLRALLQLRVVAAPLASLDNKRLHRTLLLNNATANNNNATAFQVLLPMEGSAAFSVEGLRGFLDLAQDASGGGGGGVWSHGSISDWSSVLLGTAPGMDPLSRRVLWIDWRQQESQEYPSTTTTALYGMEYTKRVTVSASSSWTLAQVLPPKTTTGASAWQPHGFGDATLRVVVPPDSDVVWHAACRADDDSATSGVTMVPLTRAIGLTERCFDLRRQSSKKSQEEIDEEDLQDYAYYKVHLNVQRPHGLANQGTFAWLVQNSHQDCPVVVSMVQSLPNIVEPVWQSVALHQSSSLLSERQRDERVPWTGSLDWKQDSIVLKWQHELPSQSSLSMALDFDPAFLSINSFPADANRGIEVPPFQAVFVSHCPPTANRTHDGDDVTLWSHPLLLLPPLPDQSMPFNVLSMTCTLYAFVIGSCFSLLVHKASAAVRKQYNPATPNQPVSLRERVRALVQRVVSKFHNKSASTDNEAEKPEAVPPEKTQES